MYTMDSILFFSRSKTDVGKFLSNFHTSHISHHDTTFNSVENAFQASKYLLSNKPEYFYHLAQMSPSEARTMGSKGGMKKVGAKLDIEVWERTKYAIMKKLILQRYFKDTKFNQELSKLNNAGIQLYHFERSGEKSYWGGYFCKKDNIFKGQNVLGNMLMGIRELSVLI